MESLERNFAFALFIALLLAGSLVALYTDKPGISTATAQSPRVRIKLDEPEEDLANPLRLQNKERLRILWESDAEYCRSYGHPLQLQNGRIWTELERLSPSGNAELVVPRKAWNLAPIVVGVKCFRGAREGQANITIPVVGVSQEKGYDLAVQNIFVRTDGDSNTTFYVRVWNFGNEKSSSYRILYSVDNRSFYSEKSEPPLEAGEGRITSFEGRFSPGEHEIYVNIETDGNDLKKENNQMRSRFVVSESRRANQPPTILRIVGPEVLGVNEVGEWIINAYDPDDHVLWFDARFGEDGPSENNIGRFKPGPTEVFKYAYKNEGVYEIKFTVKDSRGVVAEAVRKVKVRQAQLQEVPVKADIGTAPSEIYLYDTVYAQGSITRAPSASDAGAKEYLVVLSLDYGNRPVAYRKGMNDRRAGMQIKEETISLVPGEKKEVSAYFNANQLGTNILKIEVYDKSCDGCPALASDFTAIRVRRKEVPASAEGNITLRLERGWNMVSVPSLGETTLDEIRSACRIASAWQYLPGIRQYKPANSFANGTHGYWMKAEEPCEYAVKRPFAPRWSVSLEPGWNMIGAPAKAVDLNSASGNCKISSGAWVYSPNAKQYVRSLRLEPGKGYWVKVNSQCVMAIDEDMPPQAPSS